MNYTIIAIVITILILIAIPREPFTTIHRIKLIGIANTPESRHQGLMFRKTKLPLNTGLLFDYGRYVQSKFWMRNTFIDLDIIFLDHTKTVVGILRNMKAHDETSKGISKKYYYAIECNAGQMTISTGDKVVWD